ncbi:MAG: hypothetical protein AVDCRST_MAG67-2797 [uncultured Solirubrobacteraceae bacterium]|uniref:Uncharacterized protein n=1 Tax=uncultured Solirubrobacteraceae bacterium TaxID=1162706 RepID=A0A6J4T3N6_9ACTN|nr:MAG: hypothetical protein AVDCRST_MAG67-2797 [uncultured Solirubrobacteraceae bacterium]
MTTAAQRQPRRIAAHRAATWRRRVWPHTISPPPPSVFKRVTYW